MRKRRRDGTGLLMSVDEIGVLKTVAAVQDGAAVVTCADDDGVVEMEMVVAVAVVAVVAR